MRTSWAICTTHGARDPMVRSGGHDATYRCASVTKPLMFWTAASHEPYRSDPGLWAREASAAIVHSANDPSVRLWDTLGGDVILDGIASATGATWSLPTPDATFGRIDVSPIELAVAYAALASAARTGDPRALDVLGWMRQVPARHTFGVRAVVSTACRVPPDEVAVKAGWDWHPDENRLRTHVVAQVTAADQVIVVCAMSSAPADQQVRDGYGSATSGDDVIDLHWARAARPLLAAISGACQQLHLP